MESECEKRASLKKKERAGQVCASKINECNYLAVARHFVVK